MTHLDEGRILVLRDDPEAAADGELRHVDTCASCRDALEATRLRAGAVALALGTLDDGVADLERARDAVRRRVAAHAAQAVGGISLPGRRSRRAFWTLSRAAGVLLVTAAGASALPGSPVRGWIERLMAPLAQEPTAAAPTPEAAAVAEAPEEGGVRLPLSGGPVAVVLRGAVPGTEIRVTWIPGREAAVFAPVGSRFTSGEGHLEATLAEGPVRVELPRSGIPVSLEVDGGIFLRITPAGLEASGPVSERTDAGITFLVPIR